MQLIQIFLPVFDNQGQAFPKAAFDAVRVQLTDKFGGVTAFVHSPAEGLWESDEGAISRDRVVLFEVMAEAVDRNWWFDYRRFLEASFRQAEIMIRTLAAERL
jgi:hypothetical protein